VPGPLDRVDDFQRRHVVAGFPIAVVYKYADDQGAYLAAVVTYYAFIAIFPLLLIASSVLGFVLQGDTKLQSEVLTSALSQFPIVGSQLGQPEGLTGSTSAVVLGSLTALYGVLGLGQAAQNAVNVVWAVPRNSRLNPLLARVSSLLLLVLAGLTVLAVTVLTSVVSHVDQFGPDFVRGLGWLLTLTSVALNAAVLAAMMRLATTHRQSFVSSLPGALLVGVFWQVLQSVGGSYVNHVVARASQVNGTFALVLGLLALIYLASAVAVIGLEVNVVLARRLYPRALLTPFTDSVQLTDADQRVYAAYARAQRHKGFQQVQVSFAHGDDDPVADGEEPADHRT
jgi:membrane protein